MSMFPSFKLPQLLRKSSPRSEICEDVPRLKCSELPVKQGIGQGFFGDINYRYFEGISDGDSVPVLNTLAVGLLGLLVYALIQLILACLQMY